MYYVLAEAILINLPNPTESVPFFKTYGPSPFVIDKKCQSRIPAGIRHTASA